MPHTPLLPDARDDGFEDLNLDTPLVVQPTLLTPTPPQNPPDPDADLWAEVTLPTPETR